MQAEKSAWQDAGDKPLWSGVNELRAATTMAIDRIAVPNYFQGSRLCEKSDHSVRQMHDDWFCCSQGIKFWTPTLKHNQLLHIWGSFKNRVIYDPLQAEGTPCYKGKILCRLKSRLGRAFATFLERWSLSFGTAHCNMTSSWVAAHCSTNGTNFVHETKLWTWLVFAPHKKCRPCMDRIYMLMLLNWT